MFGVNKWILIGVGVLLLLLVLSFVFRKKKGPDEEVHNEQVNNAIDNYEQTHPNKKPNYSAHEYTDFANLIYNAVEGAGTDEDAVFRVIYKIRNELDYLYLNKAFGVRDGLTLASWIANDFNVQQIGKLNAELAKYGIAKKF